MHNIASVRVIDRTRPVHILDLASDYPEYWNKIRMVPSSEPSCKCIKENEAVLIPSIIYAGLKESMEKQAVEQSWMLACERQLQLSCKMVYRDTYGKDILALGAIGTKEQ
jgi:hypothetical protein